MSNLPKIGAPASRALANAGIDSLEQLSQHTEQGIKALHGIGKNALEKLRAALIQIGLNFKP